MRQLFRARDLDGLQALLDQEPDLAVTDEIELKLLLALTQALMERPDAFAALCPNLDDPCLSRLGLDGQLDWALALALNNDLDRGIEILQGITSAPAAPVLAWQRLGSFQLMAGQLDAAAETLERALQLDPNHVDTASNVGGLLVRRGDLEGALAQYNRVLAMEPSHAIATAQRDAVLAALNRVDEVVESKRQILEKDPENPEHHLAYALALQLAERHPEASAVLQAALDRFPDSRALRLALVTTCFEQKQWSQAGVRLKEWVDDEPTDWHLRLLLNQARIEAGFIQVASDDLLEIADDVEGRPLASLLRAKILVEQAKAHEARELLAEAVVRFPGDQALLYQYYEVLCSLGELEEAEAVLAQAGLLNPAALPRRVESKGYKAEPSELKALSQLAETETLPVAQRSAAYFSLAHVHEKSGEYAASFDAVQSANALIQPSLNYDWRVHRRQTDALLEVFTPDLVARLAADGMGHPSDRPIFVTGMPRSGTTLTEQILCSHPLVYGAGELPWMSRITALMPKVIEGKSYPEALVSFEREHLCGAATYYLDKISSQNSDAQFVVDKLPHNFDHIGLIALAFPNAAIIHLDRDVRDVAVSNFYQNFAHAQGLMGFAFSLEDIGHMLNDHDRLMQHWHQLFPGRIFELNYQHLVSDPEPTIRALLEHCGLVWDPAVLEFYKTQRPVRTASIRQVRQGIYTSSAEKWRRYVEYLAPLDEILAEGFRPLASAESAVQRYSAGLTR